jgi:hypothetical protein
MNAGSLDSSHSTCPLWPPAPARNSSQDMSRPGRIAGSRPPRRSTTTCRTLPQSATASSTIGFSGTSLPLRQVRSAQNTAVAPDNRSRSSSAPAPNPANTTR